MRNPMNRASCGLRILIIAATLAGADACAWPAGVDPALGQSPAPGAKARKSRAEAIPPGAVKVTPATDALPPQMHSAAYQKPVPLGDAINTAGGEDSAFVMPDGNTLYFFFTPDVNIPAEKQLFDGVTGNYVSQKQGGRWGTAKRIVLQDEGELALDGCVFVQGDTMWFGSARKGNYRDVDIWKAEFKNERWTNWKNAGRKLNKEYVVGELHVTADGSELYFHSPRPGGAGNYDIWVSRRVNGDWQEPENVRAVNTQEMDGWPFVTQDGKELWFTRWHKGSPAIFRSKRVDGRWSKPELIVSQFAAEPSLDNAGHLYFTHHYFRNGKMTEADIYVAYPRVTRGPVVSGRSHRRSWPIGLRRTVR